ncbi:endolytic transglycosylase MltG [Pendulispora albinea]|uniref:Endolytic murein transglycosylase n=1 Tax=Pendulispora albinea TaxID=2741071 RepID=A0ABZ2MCA6_9BACT
MTEKKKPPRPRSPAGPKKRTSRTSVKPRAPGAGGGGGGGSSGGMAIAKWIAVIMVAIAALLFGALVMIYPARKGAGGGREVDLVLMGDESPEALAGKLAGAGLIEDPRIFAWFVRASGASGKVAKGSHFLTDDLSPSELLTRVEKRGAATRVKVAVPEGWTRFDIAKRLHTLRVCSKGPFLEATRDPRLLGELRIEGDSAEGFLFPATYELAQDSAPEDVVRRMKSEFDRRFATLEERHASGTLDLAQTLHWGTRQIVILASMIEKEAVVDDERRTIASVFLNRLRDPKFTPKLLQCDPTAGYGCLVDPTRSPACAAYTGKITHDIVADPTNPYNTYKHEGLPPGPISNPGAKSIEAAMDASATRFFYFVAKGGGRHHFSETYAGHTAAIDGNANANK